MLSQRKFGVRKVTVAAFLNAAGVLLALGPVVADAAESPVNSAPAESGVSEAFATVLDNAKGIGSKAERLVLLVRFAQARAAAGDKVKARESLRSALELADGIVEDSIKGMAYREIAIVRLQFGDVEDATVIADKFTGATSQFSRNHLLYLLASTQAGSGEIRSARKIADLITDAQQASALGAIAQAEAKAGDIDAALATANAIGRDKLLRAAAMEEIALAQAKKGDRMSAAASLGIALQLYDENLADAPDRNGARAEIAVKLARIGEIGGALQAAGRLECDNESGHPDRAYALKFIAIEQLKKADLSGALKTLKDIPDAQVRVRALLAIAEIQIQGNERIGAEKTLTEARETANGLAGIRKGPLLDEIGAVQVSVLVLAGDLKSAIETARGLKNDKLRYRALLRVAREQIKSGDSKASLITLTQAMKAADALREDERTPESIVVLVPALTLIKGDAVRLIASVTTEAGGAEDARTWAAGQRSPFVKAMAFLGVAEGIFVKETKGKHPSR